MELLFFINSYWLIEDSMFGKNSQLKFINNDFSVKYFRRKISKNYLFSLTWILFLLSGTMAFLNPPSASFILTSLPL